MLGDRIEMSRRERDVLKVMASLLQGERKQREAARLLGRSVRHIRRLQRRLEVEGDAGVIHRARGKHSNRRIDAAFRQRVLAAYRQEYSDFGPTLAAEKLPERKLKVSVDTLRGWLLAEGLWQRRRHRRAAHGDDVCRRLERQRRGRPVPGVRDRGGCLPARRAARATPAGAACAARRGRVGCPNGSIKALSQKCY